MLKPTPRHPHGQRGEQQGGGDQHDAPGPRSLPKQEAAPAQDQAAQSQTSPGPAEGSGVPGPQPTSASQPQECGTQRDKTPSPPQKKQQTAKPLPWAMRGGAPQPRVGGGGVRVAQRGSHLLSCHGEAGTALPCAGAESEEGVHAQEAHGGEEVERNAEADVQAGEAQSQHPQPGAPP